MIECAKDAHESASKFFFPDHIDKKDFLFFFFFIFGVLCSLTTKCTNDGDQIAEMPFLDTQDVKR